MRVSLSPDDLQANAAWVRRLADYLVREGGEADDLAQETLVAALHSPRPMQMPLTTWLGGILRNVARARARSDRRRRAVEHKAHDELAMSTVGPPLGPDDLLERMELHQLLGRMVLELDEPYRSTVLLRYYEGLSAPDIAAKTGVPAGTVRWRLKQGLDGIRRKLDDRWSRREDWIAVVAPLAMCPVVPTALSLAATSAASAGGLGFLAWGASGVTLAVSVAAAVCMRPAHPDRVPVAATIEPTLPGESLFTMAGQPAPSMCNESDKTLAVVPTSMPMSADVVTSGAAAVAGPVSAGGPAQSPPALPTTTKPLRYQVPLGSGPIAGPSDAKVTVLVFMGYECPFSRKANETISRLLQSWPRDVRVQVIQAPLREHANAVPAAKAVLAAGEQGKYWEMHRLLFASREVLERSESNSMPRRLGVSPSDIDGYARKLGLEMERFHRDAASVAVESALEIDQGTTDSLGTPFGTPTFFINGRRVNGAVPNEVVDFDRIVNEELRTADQLLASGVPRAALFNEIVGTETAAHHRATTGAAYARLDPALMDQVAGGYMIDEGRKILVERSGDHLKIQRRFRPPLDLLPQSPSSFLFTDDTKPGEVIGSSHVLIVRDGGGRVTGLEVRYPEGTMQRAWRIDPAATSAGKVAPLEPRPASAANDDFESGSLTGWRVHEDGAGGWYVYTSGKSAPAPLHSDRKVPFDVPDPPQGKFAAVTDMDAPGTLLLYRDVTIDGPYRLQLELFYVTPGRFTRASALDHTLPGPNQQIRIDLVAPSAPLDSVAEEHVVTSIFRTSPGDPHQRPPTSLAFDLSPLLGRTLRLRLAVVNNTGPIRVGVDDIRFERMGK